MLETNRARNMVNLPQSTCEEAHGKIALVYFLRYKEKLTEDQIAKKLEFDPELGRTAVEVMHQWFRDLELPEWLVSSEELGDSGEPKRAEGAKTPDGANERKVLSVGDAKDLPDATRAAELFRSQIRRNPDTPLRELGLDAFTKTLEDHVDELDELRERLHGQRFLSAFEIKDDWESYDRVMFSDEEWKELCEEHGIDPAREHFALSLEPYVVPLDVEVTPSQGLTQLIAVYALRNTSQEPLLEALHPNPAKADRTGLENDVKKLRHYAQRIARRVHGGTASEKGGRPDPKVSQYELRAKWNLIDPLHKKGYSDQEIFDEVKAHRLRKEGGEHFSLDDVQRLRGLKLPPPV